MFPDEDRAFDDCVRHDRYVWAEDDRPLLGVQDSARFHDASSAENDIFPVQQLGAAINLRAPAARGLLRAPAEVNRNFIGGAADEVPWVPGKRALERF